jgi:hypothetical protein
MAGGVMEAPPWKPPVVAEHAAKAAARARAETRPRALRFIETFLG